MFIPFLGALISARSLGGDAAAEARVGLAGPILGILEAEQFKGNKKPRRNDRVIARLIESRLFAKIRNIDQLGNTFVEELSTFFSTYKRLRGQTYTVTAVGDPDRAADLILEGAEEYLAEAKRS